MIKKYPYLIARRMVQFSLLVLFAGGNYWGWKILEGNYSSATLPGTVHISDPYAVLQTLASGFIGGVDVLVGALTIIVFYGIIGGRIFCSWVCPMNVVTDTANGLRKVLKMNTPTKLLLSKNVRYWLLGFSFLLSFMLGFAAFEMVSPVSMLHRGIIFGMGSGWAVVSAIFLFDVGVTENGWCGHLCPLGAFYALVGRYGLIKVKHTKDQCTHCMDCFRVCPEEQVLSIVGKQNGFIKSGECTNCGRCVEVCNDNALKYSVNYTGNSKTLKTK